MESLGQARKFHALTQLVDLHTGEVVEVVPARCSTYLNWLLQPVCASNETAFGHPQFLCLDPGTSEEKVSAPLSRQEHGAQHNMDVSILLSVACPEAADRLHIPCADLRPAWNEQKNRVSVPCVAAPNFCWRRVGTVTTLGDLFLCFGRDFDADTIYTYYRFLHIVALKHHKR